jgi:hypothetical protein
MNISHQLTRSHSFDVSTFLYGIAAGAGAGVVCGALARISMRGVAILGDMRPEFTLEGTFFILVFCGLLGAVMALLFSMLQWLLGWSLVLKGFLYGLIWSIVTIVLFLRSEPTGELALVPPHAVLLLFIPIILFYGLLLGSGTQALIQTRNTKRLEPYPRD